MRSVLLYLLKTILQQNKLFFKVIINSYFNSHIKFTYIGRFDVTIYLYIGIYYLYKLL